MAVNMKTSLASFEVDVHRLIDDFVAAVSHTPLNSMHMIHSVYIFSISHPRWRKEASRFALGRCARSGSPAAFPWCTRPARTSLASQSTSNGSFVLPSSGKDVVGSLHCICYLDQDTLTTGCWHHRARLKGSRAFPSYRRQPSLLRSPGQPQQLALSRWPHLWPGSPPCCRRPSCPQKRFSAAADQVPCLVLPPSHCRR